MLKSYGNCSQKKANSEIPSEGDPPQQMNLYVNGN